MFRALSLSLVLGCLVAAASQVESPLDESLKDIEVQQAAEAPTKPGVVAAEFVFDAAPFPQCHASTIAGTFSASHGTESGRPFINTTTIGLPDARAAA